MILWCKRKHFYTVPQFFFACGAIYIIFLLRKKIELAMSLDTLAFCYLAKLTRLSALWLSGRRARSARRPLVAGENFFFGGFFLQKRILLISKILLFSWRILRALSNHLIFFFLKHTLQEGVSKKNQVKMKKIK